MLLVLAAGVLPWLAMRWLMPRACRVLHRYYLRSGYRGYQARHPARGRVYVLRRQ